MEPTNFTLNLAHNMMAIDDFDKTSETAPKKVASGHLCLGVKNGRLLTVDYGTDFLTSLIESIKQIFNGVRTDKEAVDKVVNETKKARLEIQLHKKAADQGTFDASLKGKVYNLANDWMSKIRSFDWTKVQCEAKVTSA